MGTSGTVEMGGRGTFQARILKPHPLSPVWVELCCVPVSSFAFNLRCFTAGDGNLGHSGWGFTFS